MKKLVLTMLVVALAIPAMAADISIGTDGVITLSVGAGEVVRGLGIIITSENDITAVENGADVGLGNTFNVFMDAAHDEGAAYDFEAAPGSPLAIIGEAGVKTLAAGDKAVSLCMGVLDLTENQLGAGEGVYEIGTVATTGVVTITIDELRGGIVGDGVTPDPTEGFLARETVGGTVCYGDITTPDGQGGPDGVVDMGDLNKVIGLLLQAGAPYSVPVTPEFEAMDSTTPDGQGGPDGLIDMGDLNKLIGYMLSLGAPYSGGCMP
jgi:hypothetical protein